MLQRGRQDTVEGLPDELISISGLQEEYENALENNQRIYNAKDNIDEAKIKITELEETIKSLRESIKENEKIIQETDFINVTQIKNKISQAEDINEHIRAKKRNEETDQRYKKAQAEYDAFTEKINELTNQKVEALNKAKMPITGLGIDDTGVTYKDIPFSQLSSSEQLKVSMAIAMSFNPKLRVIRITDGSLLDDDNMNVIKQMAKDGDFQVWVERVSDQSGIAFVIEDGGIRKEDKNAL